jgi:hypothetical protein
MCISGRFGDPGSIKKPRGKCRGFVNLVSLIPVVEGETVTAAHHMGEVL